MSDIVDEFPKDFDFTYYKKSTDLEKFDKANFEVRDEERIGAYYFRMLTGQVAAYLVEINSINKSATPLYVNQMNQAILRKFTGKKDLELNLTVAPLELTASIGSLNNADKGIGAAFIFAMCLSFIPASLITFTVKER